MELVSYQLKPFEYRTPEQYIDDNGELQITYSEDEKPIQLPSITFLYLVDFDDQGEVISVKGVDIANAYLMHLVLNKSLKDVSTQSRALIQYFSFINDEGLQWNEMPIRQSQRPTYRFKRYLEQLFRSGDSGLKASTCHAYMRNIVNFYKYHLVRGYKFTNAPFEHELITINTQANYSSMQATKSVVVHTTDLRLRIAKAQAPEIPNKLVSLSDHDWKNLDEVIRKQRKVIKSLVGERPIYSSLPLEITLIFLLMRYTGIRRQEAITITKEAIINPTKDQLNNGYINFVIGYFCGIETKGGKDREIEIPSLLMKQLYEYSISQRYLIRLDRFKAENSAKKKHPLFLTTQGERLSERTINARWSDIRRTMNVKLGRDFTHKTHNLRATYAVTRLKALIDHGIQQSDALTFVQGKLGHSNMETTLHYLKQINDTETPFQMAEKAYEHLFSINDFEV